MGRPVTNWEIGSEFHWPGVPQGPFLSWPDPVVMVSSGREAFLRIWKLLRTSAGNALFIPDYFCEDTVSWWESRGVTVRRYEDAPNRPSPVWETLAVSPGDAVLAVNYFGVRDGKEWERWRSANTGISFIEDHSHDPLSGWALDSRADYAFASLRKTLPVPDGAIIWSPRNLPLPDEPCSADWSGSSLKFAAMVLKKEFLEGADERIKEVFRGFQIEGERRLAESDGAAVTPWSRFILSSGYPIPWRQRRAENVRNFLGLIASHPFLRPLFTDWPERHCPFNAIMLFPTAKDREECRSLLINARVYPAVHWELSPSASAESLDISRRVMTLPLDQRYGEEDVMKVASMLFDI